MQSSNLSELIKALIKVQEAIKPVKKTAENPFYHSKYADLVTIWESCRATLTANGFAVTQVTHQGDNGYTLLETVLLHTSGEWLAGELPILPDKSGPQAFGSALTYARRYSLAALLGIVTEGEDDDAETATQRGKAQPKTPVRPKPPTDPSMDSPVDLKDAVKGIIGQLGWKKKEIVDLINAKLPGLKEFVKGPALNLDGMDQGQLTMLRDNLHLALQSKALDDIPPGDGQEEQPPLVEEEGSA